MSYLLRFARRSGARADFHIVGKQVIEVDNTKMVMTRHEPIGVVGQIIPCASRHCQIWFVWCFR